MVRAHNLNIQAIRGARLDGSMGIFMVVHCIFYVVIIHIGSSVSEQPRKGTHR